MNSIFKNPNVQQSFEKEGYVKLTLLNQTDVETLKQYYLNQHLDNKIEGGFHISLDNLNEVLVEEIRQKIENTLTPKLNNFFKEYKIFTSSYVIKEPGEQNIVPPHQDWTFVDEDENYSATCWIPLMDVNEDNGALGVIPGSHKLFSYPRSSPSPQSKSPLADHIFTLFPYVEIIDLKAGECLVFDNRLIHASPPNLSNTPRIAVGIGVTGIKAELKHYYQIPNTTPEKLQVFNVDSHFFTYYNNKRLSDLFDASLTPENVDITETISRDIPIYTKAQMTKLISQLDGVSYNTPLMKKLADLFNYTLLDNGDFQPKSVDNFNDNDNVDEKNLNNITNNSIDKRSFFQKYTPINLIKEAIWRVQGRP